MTSARIRVPLDIADVQVLQTQITSPGEFIITVESRLTSARCHRWGRELHQFDGLDKWVTVRHLPILGRPVYLRYRPKRYRGKDGDGHPTTTQQLTGPTPNSPHTIAYDQPLLLQLVNATVEDVRLQERWADDRVLGTLERWIAAQVDWSQYTDVGVLGLDEIALKKGHRDFVVMVRARLRDGRLAILGVLPNRDKDTVKAFVAGIPAGLAATIQTACTDLDEGYINAVHEVLSWMKVVVDRFHVAEKYRAAADTVRKQELKRLKRELSEADYRQLPGPLWAFRKNSGDLRPAEHACLERLFTYSPALKTAYPLRQDLTRIFEQAASPDRAEEQLRMGQARGRQSGRQCFDDVLNTLNRWWQEILNYFVNRNARGFVEGLNNKLKVLKRRGDGLFNRDHLFQRIFLDWEGYRLFT